MPTIVPMDKAGRIVLPKALRDDLGLSAGDSIEIDTAGDTITMKPVRSGSRLRRKMGCLVFEGGGPMTQETADRVLQDLREGRLR